MIRYIVKFVYNDDFNVDFDNNNGEKIHSSVYTMYTHISISAGKSKWKESTNCAGMYSERQEIFFFLTEAQVYREKVDIYAQNI